MPAKEETWRQIDHDLVSLKLQQSARALAQETEAKRKAIYWRNRNNENAATVPLQLLDLELEQVRKWVEVVFRTYIEVWQTQRKPKTPGLLRVVFRKAIIPGIDTRKECSSDFLQNRALRTRGSRNLLAAHLAELGRETERLKDEWRQRTEIQARELEHEEEGMSKPNVRTRRRRIAARVEGSPSPSERRARTVAKIVGELNILKPQMYGESDYSRLAKRYPDFVAFRLASQRDDLRLKIVNLQDHLRHIRLAQELAAAKHGVELSTVQTDWKKNKPKKFRQKTN